MWIRKRVQSRRSLSMKFFDRGKFAAGFAALVMTGGVALSLSTMRTREEKSPQRPVVFTDYRDEKPGVVHRITTKDLPPPFASVSVDNGPQMARRPSDAWPQAPGGFKVELYASGLTNPRLIRTAPNGDFFVAESKADRIRVLRGVGADGKATRSVIFARGLKKPFGIAFYPAREPSWVYVANTDAVVRFPYR